MIRFGLILSILLFALQAGAYDGADYCSGEAQAVAQANGGDAGTVALTYSSVNGFGVNAYGYSHYQFQRGNETCFIAYDVFGTYFGTKCSQEAFSCSNPKARSRRR